MRPLVRRGHRSAPPESASRAKPEGTGIVGLAQVKVYGRAIRSDSRSLTRSPAGPLIARKRSPDAVRHRARRAWRASRSIACPIGLGGQPGRYDAARHGDAIRSSTGSRRLATDRRGSGVGPVGTRPDRSFRRHRGYRSATPATSRERVRDEAMRARIAGGPDRSRPPRDRAASRSAQAGSTPADHRGDEWQGSERRAVRRQPRTVRTTIRARWTGCRQALAAQTASTVPERPGRRARPGQPATPVQGVPGHLTGPPHACPWVSSPSASGPRRSVARGRRVPPRWRPWPGAG